MKRKQKNKFKNLDTYLKDKQQEQAYHQQGESMTDQLEEEEITNHHQKSTTDDSTKVCPEVKNESLFTQPLNSHKRKGKGKNNNPMYELNHLAKFRAYDDDPFLDDPHPKPQFIPQNSFHLRPTKKPNELGYESQFKVGESIKLNKQSSNNNIDEINNDIGEISISNNNILDQHLIESYIHILDETFPDLDRKDIATKICQYNFDIDKVVLFYFNNIDLTNSEYSQYENMVISNIESLSNSFAQEFKHNDNISIEQISQNNVQNHIEKELKKKSVLDQVNTTNYNEKDYPFVSEEIKKKYYDSFKVSSEYFLDKQIQEIQTVQIKKDLIKLCQAFPFEDEFVIKWVYYQFMDYPDAISFLEKRHFNHSAHLKNLIENSNKKSNDKQSITDYEYYNYDDDDNKKTNTFLQNDPLEHEENEMKIMEILCKKPINWYIYKSQDECININEYQSIRRQLIKQANIAWQAGRGRDAKAIMAKARRYKAIIDEMILKRKVKTFTKNNRQYAIDNMYSKKEITIDLHGLSFDEAIIILKHKLFDEESEMSLNRKLVIITGKGNNSVDNQPVLFPKISKWLKDRNGIKSTPDYNKGIITIYY